MWTISENLHRAELTEVQRSQQMAEFVTLSTRSGRRRWCATCPPPTNIKGASGREAGISAAARDLGVTREEIRRRQTIAALPEATLAAAKKSLGLDDSQAALLAAARAEEPEEQIEVLETITATRQRRGRDPPRLGRRRPGSPQSGKHRRRRARALDQADDAQRSAARDQEC